MTEQEAPPVEDAALQDALATAVEASQNPVELARANAHLRSMVKGAHALVFVLVQRLGGSVTVERSEHQSPDPKLELDIKVLASGDVALRVKPRINTAIRKRKK